MIKKQPYLLFLLFCPIMENIKIHRHVQHSAARCTSKGTQIKSQPEVSLNTCEIKTANYFLARNTGLKIEVFMDQSKDLLCQRISDLEHREFLASFSVLLILRGEFSNSLKKAIKTSSGISNHGAISSKIQFRFND